MSAQILKSKLPQNGNIDRSDKEQTVRVLTVVFVHVASQKTRRT